MSRLTVLDTPLTGLKEVVRQRMGDTRGTFSRIFCEAELQMAGWCRPIAQINQTVTMKAGAVRGLHYQNAPHAEMKLVSCLMGEVWDVAVDLRPSSATFLQWYGTHLSANNGRALLIPEGFAHGFQALCDEAQLLYCHSSAYVPASEAGLDALDRRLAIAWPLPITVRSSRDLGLPAVDSHFCGARV
jgi:dTDP-4-dehydrorhamnose 3,5-epimerase